MLSGVPVVGAQGRGPDGDGPPGREREAVELSVLGRHSPGSTLLSQTRPVPVVPYANLPRVPRSPSEAVSRQKPCQSGSQYPLAYPAVRRLPHPSTGHTDRGGGLRLCDDRVNVERDTAVTFVLPHRVSRGTRNGRTEFCVRDSTPGSCGRDRRVVYRVNYRRFSGVRSTAVPRMARSSLGVSVRTARSPRTTSAHCLKRRRACVGELSPV